MIELQENVPLGPLTTWKLGGAARWFVTARTNQDVIDAVAMARERHLDFRILGNGSNTLVSDQGFQGLIIVTRNDHLTWNLPSVIAGAGVKFGQLVAGALNHGLGGLDFLIGVPGSVGGGVYGNAGARDLAIGDYVEWVDGIRPDGQTFRWTQAECEFTYRNSRFKREPTVILQASLNVPLVDVRNERQRLAEKAAWKNTAQPTTEASAGCMFQNPRVGAVQLPPELKSHIFPDGTISAWRLIQAVDLQGKRLGQMQISPVHANFLVNLGDGTADQAVQLISFVKQQVRDKLGIQLQEEIQYLGF